MIPETEGNEEKGPSGVPFINDPNKLNDPGNEDPGSLMDDATVPLDEEEEPEESPDDPDIAGIDGSNQPE
jgi:hypothetical protein